MHYVDDEHIVTFFRDNSLFLWSNEKCLGQLWGPENVHITAVYVAKDQGKVILGGRSDKFYFYSLKELKLISILEVKDMQKGNFLQKSLDSRISSNFWMSKKFT